MKATVLCEVIRKDVPGLPPGARQPFVADLPGASVANITYGDKLCLCEVEAASLPADALIVQGDKPAAAAAVRGFLQARGLTKTSELNAVLGPLAKPKAGMELAASLKSYLSQPKG